MVDQMVLKKVEYSVGVMVVLMAVSKAVEKAVGKVASLAVYSVVVTA